MKYETKVNVNVYNITLILLNKSNKNFSNVFYMTVCAVLSHLPLKDNFSLLYYFPRLLEN